jgi:hypothetical protein
MPVKVWQAGSIKNHLLAVQAGINAGAPLTLVQDNDQQLTLYCSGSEAAIRYLAQRFGIDFSLTQAASPFQTGELRLKTWTLSDIKRNLQVAWLILLTAPPGTAEQHRQLEPYTLGIKDTLQMVALSFGVEGGLPPETGAMI